VNVRRLVLIAAVGILGIGAAAIGTIMWITSGPPGDGPEQVAGPGWDSQDGGTVPGQGDLPPLPQPLRVPSSALVSPEQRAWEEIRPLTRPIAPLVRAISPPLEPCFDEETKARFGPAPHTSVSDASPSGSGPTTLVLWLEAVDGGLRIVDAPVARVGLGGDGLVACAQRVLRGRTVALPQLRYKPGDRLTMSYTLNPTSVAGGASGTVPKTVGVVPPSTPRHRGKGVPVKAP
jgi:hypothetical protein